LELWILLSGTTLAFGSKSDNMDNNKMARVCLLVFIAASQLEMYGLAAEITEENTGR